MEGINEESHCSSALSQDENLVAETKAIHRAALRTWLITLLLLLVGGGASGIFMYMGISAAKNDQEVSFERRASEFSKEIDGAWDDYETAARWVHSECRSWRKDNFTYEDFEAVYQYIVDGGLNTFSIDWIPNITHAERAETEQKEGAFWRNIEGAENYAGFTGQEPDPEHPGELVYANRSDQPFYYPIYFVEPKSAAASIAHYDLWSAPWEQPAMQKAIETYTPQITARFILAQHTEEDGYSAILYHPGVKLSEHIDNQYQEERHDLSLIIMTLNLFLEHAARNQREPMAVYLYDKTLTEMDPETSSAPEFLGGVEITYDGNGDRKVTLLKEIEHETVLQESRLKYEREIQAGGRVWTTVVVAVDGTYEPDLLFVLLCGCMIFAASVLLAWIWVMHNQRHTKQVMEIVDKAAAESKIVSSLYPAAVREHMIKQHRRETEAAKKEKSPKGTFLKSNNEFFDMFSTELSAEDEEKSSGGMYKTKPIAQQYQSTTIMFADLAGFTAWSASRSPEDVFILLETLYGAFDAIARRRKVFKVETVGDCYVAVAGLPKPRRDHAVVMCRFANDCLQKMQELTNTLALGPLKGTDTADLGFRVGLHSGKVTAGVLRGDKGRFQLFGDTMNYASRMETTGIVNKIQVSEETADLLMANGYSKWLTPREDTVPVKGKGTVQTFFVSIVAGSTSSHHSGTRANTDVTLSFSDDSVGGGEHDAARLRSHAKEGFFDEEYDEVVEV